MDRSLHLHLSRRESQIMDAVYRLGEASVADVVDRMPDDPSYNTVRVTLGILEKKGFVQHREDGNRYLYAPTIPREKAKDSALQHVLQTFFEGSSSKAIIALLGLKGERLSKDDLDDISEWIEKARREAG